ncbi:SNF-related serine/threonine-protein kinase-like [Colius striatus]|uniref:SNF-related serine/threonine-protein kinase-like n=1 Tax=Colius striatus TaxID=57412 RepID=UPI002B1D7234|nr:SNF-related serine/threonine-protein kinase-like [Colius striatus]XP_061863202.1 SNF-related serine/threonine-protein kinase-like [Colius striatus]XP_061863203.1 SNF-related serine/threonine-protein kinase-like [Colius striatus]
MAAAQGCGEGQIAGLYDLERTLGKGHFAVVKLARHVFTGQRVAVKVIDKSKLAGEAAGQLLQEVRCMKLVQHPNVVRLYEVIDTHAKLYLILELGDGGDMFDHIMRHEGGLAEPRAKHYFAQIVHAISYCHKLHVVHRDLKPENVVFFQEQGLVKLTDFGFSNRFQPGKMLTTSCGSLAYSAPEILLGDEYDAPAVDIWSLGVILYMLVCGHPPFQEANDSETLTMIMDCRYSVPPHVSAQCADLISRMLQRDPKQRASLEQIEAHAWLQGVDPSPASRCLLPLTSHKRVSEQEHEIILQAMTCGNIADRDTIQEALEADRYNHITATYFLLAERMLRERQEKQGHGLSLVYNLAKEVQSRTNVPAGFGPLGAGCRAPPVPSAADASGRRSPLSVPAVDAAISKSSPALQQICEEEEEEEEEEEGRPGAAERKSSSLNQEQMRAFLLARRRGAELGGCAGRPGAAWAGKGLGGGRGVPARRGRGEQPPRMEADAGPGGSEAGAPGAGAALPSRRGSSAGVSPGPDATPGSQPGPAASSTAAATPAGPAQRPAQSLGPASGEAVRAAPGKGKGGSLRDRLLQLPLCEKALAFRLRPGSRDGLLSLGQFNCCHVI